MSQSKSQSKDGYIIMMTTMTTKTTTKTTKKTTTKTAKKTTRKTAKTMCVFGGIFVLLSALLNRLSSLHQGAGLATFSKYNRIA